MKIKSNASPDEISSPFFVTNKEFCYEFENYIASKNGKVKGNYNAWSFLVFGKISNPKAWNLMCKKASYTSGNIFLSSEYQSLLVMAEWETERKGNHDYEFLIRKKTRTDFLKIPLSKSLSNLDFSSEYVIKAKGNMPKLLSELIEILKGLFISEEIYKVVHSNEKLRIELRTDKHHFEVLDKLIEL
jgi:hypothetical protein